MSAEFADERLDKMAMLAGDLIDYNAELESRIADLQGQLAQTKTASVVRPGSIVSEQCADATCRALAAAGLISDEQQAQVKQAFLNDPEAAHRTIHGLLEAERQTKTAAAAERELSGGRLVSGGSAVRSDVFEDSLNKIQSILGISL